MNEAKSSETQLRKSSITKVIIFSEQGDPRLLKTWSNVPFFLVSNLESRDIKVITVNLEVEGRLLIFIKKTWNYIFNYIIKPKRLFFDFHRTKLYSLLANFKIKKTVRDNPDAEYFIFTTFSFSAVKYSTKPSILFCDWTIDYHINYFLDRTPNWLEKTAISRQNRVLKGADLVFVLFPGICNYLNRNFKEIDFVYNGNVVNNLQDNKLVNIEQKWKNKKILFIGSKKYIYGAKKLIETVKILQAKLPEVELNIIGIPKKNFGDLPSNVNVFSYLDKDNIVDRDRYYELLRSSTVFVNTTPKWGAFSASLEAMYFFNPIIVTPYQEFILTFGSDIKFGSFLKDNRDLERLLTRILNSSLDDYSAMAHNAANSVVPYSWKIFTDNFINRLSTLKISDG